MIYAASRSLVMKSQQMHPQTKNSRRVHRAQRIVGLCWLLGATLLACGPDPAEVTRKYSEAQRLYAKGDRDAATGALNAVLELVPDHAGAHIMLGKLDYLAGDAKAAGEHFAAVQDAHPENVDSQLWMARVRSHKDQDLPGALAMLDAVLAVDGGNPEAWYLKGNLHERRGDLQEAMAAYRYGLESRKFLARMYLRLATIYARAELKTEARRYLEDAAVLARDDAYLRAELEAVKQEVL